MIYILKNNLIKFRFFNLKSLFNISFILTIIVKTELKDIYLTAAVQRYCGDLVLFFNGVALIL